MTGGYWLGGFGEWRTVLPDHSCDLALEYRGEHWPVRWLCDNPGLSELYNYVINSIVYHVYCGCFNAA